MKKTAKNISNQYTHKTALTGRPEISEYFFAGLNEGGASIEPSAKKKKINIVFYFNYTVDFLLNFADQLIKKTSFFIICNNLSILHVTSSGFHGNSFSAATICFRFFQTLVFLLPAFPLVEC